MFVKLFLYFGHSAAPNPYNCVGAPMPYETRGSVRGLNWWEYEWLALSPKFNARTRTFLLDGGVIMIAFVSETFFGLKNASN